MIISFKPLLSFSEIQAEGGKKEGMISSSEKHILLPAPSHPFPCQGYLALSAGTVCSEEERKSPPALLSPRPAQKRKQLKGNLVIVCVYGIAEKVPGLL